MPAPTNDDSADLNLLFAFLALQMNFNDREELLQGMSIWVNHKSRSLGDILMEQGFLTKDRHEMLETLVEEHLRQHDNDPEKSLVAVHAATMSLAAVRDALGNVGDEDIEISIARLSPSPVEDAGQTWQLSSMTDKSIGSRFRVLRPHAKGGLGQVFVARDDELNREVALKEIQPQYADDQMSRGRFVLEAEITGGLEHPGIVPVYGMGAYPDGRPYYAMRFIRGDSLKDTIARFHKSSKNKKDPGSRSLEFRKLLRRFTDVCYAMEYAHSRHVLHRDIKPGNIMLGKYGETMVVDWGMAKVVNITEDDPTMNLDHLPITPTISKNIVATSMGSTVGTPPYMSPEQAAGRLDRLGPASDIYGLGATLFHLLTGRAPFRDKDVGSVLNRVMAGDFEPPRQVDASVPKPLEAICLKAMSLSSDQRYESASELAEDIEHWLADEPVTAYEEPFWQKTARWFRRHKAWAQAVAVSLVTISVVSTVAFMTVNRALQEEKKAKLAAAEAQLHEEQAKEEAQEQRDFAVDRLHDARNAVDKFVVGAAEALKYETLYQDVRHQILRMAVEEYAKLAEHRAEYPSLEIERGRALVQLGKAERMMGNTTEAMNVYHQAMQIFQNYDDHSDATLEIVRTYNQLGLAHTDENQRDAAEQAYRDAIAFLQPIVEAHPDEFDFSDALGDVYHHLAVLQRDAGQTNEAKSSLQEAISQYDHLRNRSLGHHQYVVALAKSRLVLGRILLDLGHYEQALEEFDMAIRNGEAVIQKTMEVDPTTGSAEQIQRLVQTDMDNVDAREVVATASLERASALGMLGRYQEQLAAYEVAVRGYTVLSNILRHVQPYRENLSATLNNQGWAFYRQGLTQEAEFAFRQALISYEDLVNLYKLPRYFENKAVTIDGTAKVLSERGNHQDASLAHQTAAGIFGDLAEKFPDVPRYAERQAVALGNLAHVLHKMDRLDQALKQFQVVVESLDQLILDQPLRPDTRDAAAAIYKQYAELQLSRGDEAAAQEAFERAKSYWQDIANANQTAAAEHLNRLARFLANCSLESLRDIAAAGHWAREAHQMAPKNPSYCTTLGIIEYRSGNWGKAIEWLNQTIALRENEPQATELFFLSMALWQQALGPQEQAAQYFQQAGNWTDKNRPGNANLARVRTEAAQVRVEFNTTDSPEPAKSY
ncbi:MAG: protein kinase [Pirellulaceae bacterium]|nr:protein kinase [Pirellulaceae bacterium]